MSSENMKRTGSLESPQIPAKVPKIENDQVVTNDNEEKLDEKIENSKINDVMMKKMDKIVEQIERYKSNQDAYDNLNSKLDTVLSVLNDDKFKIFNPELGNMMTCYFERFFDIEDFMANYGITGKSVTSKILSYLDFKSMMAARMVSKTWYAFIENERGLWINLMRKCFERIEKKLLGQWPADLTSLPEWQSFGDKIIEKNGKVADIVTLISTFKENNPNKRNKTWQDQGTNYFRTPIDTIKHFSQRKDANNWQNLNYVKILVKYGVLDNAMGQENFLNEGYLLSWSLWEIEALKFVVSTLREKFQFKLPDYSHYFRYSESSPMWDAMMQKEKGLEKVRILAPLTSKKFWNSGKKMRYSGCDHTLLADAIMIGNVEIAKEIIPYTKVEGNPKGRRFGSYLHLAAKYGQPAILKMLIFHGLIMEYKELKDKEGRTVYDLLKDESFQVENYDQNQQCTVKPEGDEGKKCKREMLKFIESIM